MANKIKYDNAMLRMLRIITLISLTVFAIGVILIYLKVSGIEVLILSCLYIGGGVFVFGGLNWMNGRFYVTRLNKYGYEVPQHRKDYGNLIERLPYTKQTMNQDENHKESLNLMLFSVIVFLASWVGNVTFLYNWRILFQSFFEVLIMFCILFVIDSYWLISIFIYKKQMNQHKYRDDVEIDAKRKARISVGTGLIFAIMFLGITLLTKTITYHIVDYMLNVNISHDKNMVCDIQESVKETYLIYKDNQNLGEEERKAVTDTLIQGVTLTDISLNAESEEAVDVFWTDVANHLQVENFKELRDGFKVADGPAVLTVQLDADTIRVELQNPDSKVDVPMVSNGTQGERPRMN